MSDERSTDYRAVSMLLRGQLMNHRLDWCLNDTAQRVNWDGVREAGVSFSHGEQALCEAAWQLWRNSPYRLFDPAKQPLGILELFHHLDDDNAALLAKAIEVRAGVESISIREGQH